MVRTPSFSFNAITSTGHIAAQAPQAMQSGDGSLKGVEKSIAPIY